MQLEPEPSGSEPLCETEASQVEGWRSEPGRYCASEVQSVEEATRRLQHHYRSALVVVAQASWARTDNAMCPLTLASKVLHSIRLGNKDACCGRLLPQPFTRPLAWARNLLHLKMLFIAPPQELVAQSQRVHVGCILARKEVPGPEAE